jgi:hypothetical protein
MEDVSDGSKCRCLFVLAMIMLLPAAPAWSDSAPREENGAIIRVSLNLSDDPNDNGQGWKVIQFRSKLPNKVVSDKDGLHIAVQCSAGLLVYCLSEQTPVHGILLRGAVTGLPRIPEGRRQGDKKADDFAMRIGLVVSGTKKLGKTKKLFAPELVKRLFELMPKSQGIDHVLFLNLANDPPPKWRRRIHPLGKGLLREQVACVKKEPGDFKLKVAFEKPLTVVALCICCDGDDTKSRYQVTVKSIQLNPKTEKDLR